jgi:ABC-2 type transport system permease protein
VPGVLSLSTWHRYVCFDAFAFSAYEIGKRVCVECTFCNQNVANRLSILDKAERQHLSSSQISSILAQPQFTITSLQQTQDTRSTADIVTGIILAYVGSILVYMAIMIYGNGVAQGVVEEKGSHIMEILVIAATPFQLMAGKIIGIGAAGLTQMAGLVVAGAGMLELQIPIKAVVPES